MNLKKEHTITLTFFIKQITGLLCDPYLQWSTSFLQEYEIMNMIG